MKLYELTADYQSAVEKIENEIEEQGTISDETLNALDSIQGSLAQKADNCAKAISIWKSELSAVDTELKRLQDLKARIQRQIDNLKNYVVANMQVAGMTAIKGDLFKLRLQDSPMKIEYDDIEKVDPSWVKEKVTKYIPKKKLLDYIKQTGDVPRGITITQNKHLRIY